MKVCINFAVNGDEYTTSVTLDGVESVAQVDGLTVLINGSIRLECNERIEGIVKLVGDKWIYIRQEDDL